MEFQIKKILRETYLSNSMEIQIPFDKFHFEPHQMTLQEYLEKCKEKYRNTPDTPLTQDQSTFAVNHKI